MAKGVAVLVRELQAEALRVAVGQTLKAERVEVFVLDRRLADSPEIAMYVDVLKELGMPVATNVADNPGLQVLSNARIAERIAACEVTVPY